jgi:hypothetical protein
VQFRLNTGAARYDRYRSEAVLGQVLEAVQALPGVEAATLVVAPVLNNALIGFALDVEGYSASDGARARAGANVVAPGYFRMMGTPLLRGRDFSETDTAQSRRVAIVSESFVKQYFQNLDPIGRTIGLGYAGPERFHHEIVGVSKDARLNNLRDEPTPTFYLPYTQFNVLNSGVVLIRSAVDPNLLRLPIEELVRRHDPELPVIGYVTIDEQIDRLLRAERLVASLSLSFGLLATGLGALGLYGVLAFSVAPAGMVAIGICIGIVLALALGRYVESQLYGVHGRDLATLGAAVGVLAIVALASGWLPARRASRVDPMLALRYE